MSSHCCSCDCQKIIVNCGQGICTSSSPAPATDTEPESTSTPQDTPQETVPACSMARVDFVTLRVSDDGDNGAGDWTLVLEANGIQDIKEYDDDAIDDDDNIPYNIGVSILVPIDQFTTELRVKVSGYERDSWFNGENDPLPVAQRTWAKDSKFGLGQTFDISANNDDVAYSVTVRISCAKMSTMVMSREQLIQGSAWKIDRESARLMKHNKQPAILAEAVALNQSIRAMERIGWKLKSIGGDALIFEGYGKVPALQMNDPRKQVKPVKGKP